MFVQYALERRLSLSCSPPRHLLGVPERVGAEVVWRCSGEAQETEKKRRKTVFSSPPRFDLSYRYSALEACACFSFRVVCMRMCVCVCGMRHEAKDACERRRRRRRRRFFSSRRRRFFAEYSWFRGGVELCAAKKWFCFVRWCERRRLLSVAGTAQEEVSAGPSFRCFSSRTRQTM